MNIRRHSCELEGPRQCCPDSSTLSLTNLTYCAVNETNLARHLGSFPSISDIRIIEGHRREWPALAGRKSRG